MRFMILRKADQATEAEALPSEALLAAMLAYNEELARAGVLLQGEGLRSSAKGARVKFTDGQPSVTDGPFTETKELIAGFTMIQARSLEEALAWARRWPREDGDVELEVRQVFEEDDFGAEFTPELRAREQRLREQTSERS